MIASSSFPTTKTASGPRFALHHCNCKMPIVIVIHYDSIDHDSIGPRITLLR